MILWLGITIPVTILVGAVSFVSGVRHCANKMLPGLVARKTDEELDVFADQVAAERDELLGGPVTP